MTAPEPGGQIAGGPQVGDRVEVRLTGTVLRRYDGKYSSVQIELDGDSVTASTVCAQCDPDTDCEDTHHPGRDQVTTSDAPDAVVVLERAGAGSE